MSSWVVWRGSTKKLTILHSAPWSSLIICTYGFSGRQFSQTDGKSVDSHPERFRSCLIWGGMTEAVELVSERWSERAWIIKTEVACGWCMSRATGTGQSGTATARNCQLPPTKECGHPRSLRGSVGYCQKVASDSPVFIPPLLPSPVALLLPTLFLLFLVPPVQLVYRRLSLGN
jgi:hypothetical protein